MPVATLMRPLILAPSLAAALVAACGQPAPSPAPTATPGSGGYAAKVAALAPGQRAGVLLRAIRDAGQSCQQVVDQSRAAASAGPAAWVATCEDKHRWVVVIGDDGAATVVDAKDVARSSGASPM